MRGEVLTYDDGAGTGLISGDDGVRYNFVRSDLQQLTPVRAGTKVDFLAGEGVASHVFVLGHTPSRVVGSTPGVSGAAGASDWKTLFFDAAGRIGQKDYWIGFGILFAVNLVLSWVPLIGVIVSLGAAYAGVCVSSKRLHDMGRSGWLAAIPYGVFALATVLSAVSVVGMIGAASYDSGIGALAGAGTLGLLWTVAVAVNIGFVIWLGVTVGQQGDNAYGPPPHPLVTV